MPDEPVTSVNEILIGCKFKNYEPRTLYNFLAFTGKLLLI